MELETMLYEISDDNVALITLNRPENLNAINLRFTIDLRRALIEAAYEEKVRCVLITGAGRAFCAGADLKARPQTSEGHIIAPRQAFLETNLYFHSAISLIADMDKPVIAAVNGPAVGAGMSLALACDLVGASEGASFYWAYTSRALVPDGGSTLHIPRRIGFHRAMELALLGKRLPAKEAFEWGMINLVSPDEGFMEEMFALAKKVASGPTWAFGQTKRLIRTGPYHQLETHMELENKAISRASMTEDFIEGVTSFLQKREPNFKGK